MRLSVTMLDVIAAKESVFLAKKLTDRFKEAKAEDVLSVLIRTVNSVGMIIINVYYV